ETKADTKDWRAAFEALASSIKEERKAYPEFASEFTDLTETTGSSYDFTDIIEEYFDHLEENKAWQDVIDSSEELVALFKWEKSMPSQFMFRKGNALEKLGRIDEALEFGEEWLKKYPEDLYAVASNVFINVEMKRFEKADALIEKHLREYMICDKKTDTFLMAAYRLYEVTNNINAKQRLEKKINEYKKMTEK
nr:hypothetical protein [Treponemataceae bacterium]